MKRTGSFGTIPLLLLAAYAQEGALPTGYTVYQRSSLTRGLNGIDGELQLLQDARLSPALRKQMWGQMPIEMLDQDNPASPFKRDPARKAIVRIAGRDGRVAAEKQFGAPLAKMEEAHLYGDDRITYLIAVDYSAGMGSYSGPATYLLEVAGGEMKWLEAVDKASGKREPIEVASTLKTAWKLTDAPRGTPRDILQAACRPDLSASPSSSGDVGFFLIYTQYSFNGKNWVKLERREKGFAEIPGLADLLDRRPFP